MGHFRFQGHERGGSLQIPGARAEGVTPDFSGTRGVGHFRSQGHKRGGSLEISGARWEEDTLNSRHTKKIVIPTLAGKKKHEKHNH